MRKSRARAKPSIDRGKPLLGIASIYGRDTANRHDRVVVVAKRDAADHVDANLMRAAGFKSHAKPRGERVMFDRLVPSHCCPTRASADSHELSALPTAPDRFVDTPIGRIQMAPHKRDILPRQGPVRELCGEIEGGIVFRDAE